MTLYIDVLFAINFSMDFLSLYLTSVILHKKIYKTRIIISAVLGSIYGIIEFIFPLKATISILFSIMVSILMCVLTFKKCSIGKYFTSFILFWGVSASLGGLMSVVYSFINKIFYEYIKDYSYTEIYSGARFFIIASISVFVATMVNRIYTNKKEIKETEIEISFKNTIYKMKGMCDSGNLLKEPISGRSVILISKNSQLGKIIDNENEIKKRYIPYSVVDGEGILKGILPNSIVINGNEVNAIVAPIDNKNIDGLEAIIPSSLL